MKDSVGSGGEPAASKLQIVIFPHTRQPSLRSMHTFLIIPVEGENIPMC